MAYRHECLCKYCRRHEGSSPTAKRMSVKLDRIDGHTEERQELSVYDGVAITELSDYYDEQEKNLG